MTSCDWCGNEDEGYDNSITPQDCTCKTDCGRSLCQAKSDSTKALLVEQLSNDEDLDGLLAMYAASEKENTSKSLKGQIIRAILSANHQHQKTNGHWEYEMVHLHGKEHCVVIYRRGKEVSDVEARRA